MPQGLPIPAGHVEDLGVVDVGDEVQILPLVQAQLPVHLRRVVHKIQIVRGVGGVGSLRRRLQILFKAHAGGAELLHGDEVAGHAEKPVRRQLFQPTQAHEDGDAVLEPLHPVQYLRQGDGDLSVVRVLLVGQAQMGQSPDQVPRLRLTAACAQIKACPLVEGQDVVPILLHAPAPSRRRLMSSASVKVYLLLQK